MRIPVVTVVTLHGSVAAGSHDRNRSTSGICGPNRRSIERDPPGDHPEVRGDLCGIPRRLTWVDHEEAAGILARRSVPRYEDPSHRDQHAESDRSVRPRFEQFPVARTHPESESLPVHRDPDVCAIGGATLGIAADGGQTQGFEGVVVVHHCPSAARREERASDLIEPLRDEDRRLSAGQRIVGRERRGGRAGRDAEVVELRDERAERGGHVRERPALILHDFNGAAGRERRASGDDQEDAQASRLSTALRKKDRMERLQM